MAACNVDFLLNFFLGGILVWLALSLALWWRLYRSAAARSATGAAQPAAAEEDPAKAAELGPPGPVAAGPGFWAAARAAPLLDFFVVSAGLLALIVAILGLVYTGLAGWGSPTDAKQACYARHVAILNSALLVLLGASVLAVALRQLQHGGAAALLGASLRPAA